MATKAAVAVGVLPTTGSVNLTVSGFGTVSAAIIVTTTAHTTANPTNRFVLSVGFWDGVNSAQHCNSVESIHGVTTTDANRWKNVAAAVEIGGSLTYTCAATTDGIALTKSAGTTSNTRYVAAFLIGGATDVHLEEISLGTGTSPIPITTPGFKPSIVFFSSISTGTSGTTTAPNAQMSFGAAHNNSSDVVSQGVHAIFSDDAVGTSDTSNYISDSYCAAQITGTSLSWAASVGSFDTSGFSITPSASAGNDYVSYLAVQLPDADDAWVDIIDAAISTGNSGYTGTGFTPQAVGIVTGNAASLGTVTSDSVTAFGVGDTSNDRGFGVSDDDNLGTTDTSSEVDLTSILMALFGDGTKNALATLNSLDSNGFTLNYSDAASSAIKMLSFAIGDSTAGGGGPSVNINGSTVSWNGLTSYNWNGIA